jgi:hypothetical protein
MAVTSGERYRQRFTIESVHNWISLSLKAMVNHVRALQISDSGMSPARSEADAQL